MGLCVGLPILFRERVDGGSRLWRTLAASAYTVYLIHFLIVIALQFAVAPAALPPLGAFALVTVAAVPLCFLVAGLLRRLPGLRAVL